ncbi:uncharacterized protein LOC144622286 isoform X2 [Crassostrea virginica]
MQFINKECVGLTGPAIKKKGIIEGSVCFQPPTMIADHIAPVEIFHILHLINHIVNVNAFTIPCNASLQTLQKVSECPMNLTSYQTAARKKNCSSSYSDVAKCDSFQYHCVLSEDLEYLVEVCAPSFYIIGHVCARFSSKLKSIIRIHGMDCNNTNVTNGCPFSYLSTKAYKYPQCYTNFTSEQTLSTNTIERGQNTKAVITMAVVMPIFIGILILTIALSLRRRGKKRKRKDESSETPEDATTELLQDFHQENDSKLSENASDDIFEQWRLEDDLFVSTKASQKVEKMIESNNIIIVVGHPGCGKAAIVQHISLIHKKQDWAVKLVNQVSEIVEIFGAGHFKENKTVFVIYDPIGKHSYDESLHGLWKRYESSLKNFLKKNKLLMTCRNWILRDKRVTGLFEDKDNIVVLDEGENKLSSEEKLQILNTHTCNAEFTQEELTEILKTDMYFPLLCKLFASNREYFVDVITFFKEPKDVLKKQLRTWKDTDKNKHCALLCLAFFDNTLSSINVSENNNLFKQCLNICDMPDSTHPDAILESADTLLNSFVRRIGCTNSCTYHFYHDFVMEVTTSTFGTDYPEQTIRYADIAFLRRNVRFDKYLESNCNIPIVLSDKYINNLVDRFLEEIVGNRFMEVVLNPCLRNEILTDLLCEKLKGSHKKLKLMISKKKLKHKELIENNVLNERFLSRIDFVYWFGEISPLFALILCQHDKLALFCLKRLREMKTDLRKIDAFAAVCCNGSTDLLNVFLKEEIEECVKQKILILKPIHIASLFHNYKLISELVSHGISVNMKVDASPHLSPLILAIRNETLQDMEFANQNRDETVNALLQNGASVNLCEETGISPLYTACELGHSSTVTLLLNEEADVNLCTKIQISPLYVACKNGHASTVNLLLEYGIELGKTVASPLHIACQNGHDNVVLVLLRYANINQCKKNGMGPLHKACYYGRVSTVKLLLDKGANVNMRDNTLASPLYISCKVTTCEVEKRQENIVQLLLEKNADVNLCDIKGMSPLYVASQNGHERILKILLDNGANVNLCTTAGTSPLHIACQNGHDSPVKLLLSFKAEVNMKTKKGYTPLHFACYHGHENIVQRLIDYGADVNPCKGIETSPLLLASHKGHFSTAQLLRNNGAQDLELKI